MGGVQHDVMADAHAAVGWIAGEGRVLGQQPGLVQQVDDLADQFFTALGADGVVEVAQARGRRRQAVAETQQGAPAGAVATGQEWARRRQPRPRSRRRQTHSKSETGSKGAMPRALG